MENTLCSHSNVKPVSQNQILDYMTSFQRQDDRLNCSSNSLRRESGHEVSYDEEMSECQFSTTCDSKPAIEDIPVSPDKTMQTSCCVVKKEPQSLIVSSVNMDPKVIDSSVESIADGNMDLENDIEIDNSLIKTEARDSYSRSFTEDSDHCPDNNEFTLPKEKIKMEFGDDNGDESLSFQNQQSGLEAGINGTALDHLNDNSNCYPSDNAISPAQSTSRHLKDIHSDHHLDVPKKAQALTNWFMPVNRKNASSIWMMMTRSRPGIARCNLCGYEFKYDKGTSNLKRHIKTKHATIKTVPEGKSTEKKHVTSKTVPKGKLTETKHATTKAVPEGKLTEGSVQQGNLGSPNIKHVPVEGAMNRVTKYRPESEKTLALDKKLLAMIYEDMQPFSIVEDQGFKAFCREMDARYELPSRLQLKRGLYQTYQEKKSALIDMLSQVDSVAITTDSWTSLNMQSFLTVTAHFYEPLPSWKLHSTVLATRPEDKTDSSAEGLAEILNEVFEEFGIKNKIRAATTDNASTMVNLVKDHLKVFHVRCFAHSLNLVVKDAIKSTQGFSSVIDQVRAVVNHFHKSAKATARLQSVMNAMGMTPLKLVQEVLTRWNSTLKMLRRYIELHRAVTATLIALGRTDLIISYQNVKMMKDWCESLEPFEEANEMMSTDKKTLLSQMLVVVRQMQRFLNNESAETDLGNNLLKEMSDRFRGIEENFPMSAATLLDPRFRRLPFADTDTVLRARHEEKIISMMKPLFNSIRQEDSRKADTENHQSQPAARKRSFMTSFRAMKKEDEMKCPQQLSDPRDELRRYMSLLYLDEDKDPSLWWQEHTAQFPHLSMIARKYSFIPATSVPSERLFSKAGELVLKRRSCLNPSTIDMVLFLNQQ